MQIVLPHIVYYTRIIAEQEGKLPFVMHVCLCVCLMGGHWKLFDPESNTGSCLD